jgi:predicted transposase/invertase (TIGR01784 family)
MEKGIAQGIAQGKLEEAIAIARELKKEGLAIEFIAKTTKLSIEEIEKL